MSEKEVNPSKRSQENENSIVWDMKKELESYRKLYEVEYNKAYYWHNKEWEARQKENEWKLFSIILITVIVILKIVRVI